MSYSPTDLSHPIVLASTGDPSGMSYYGGSAW